MPIHLQGPACTGYLPAGPRWTACPRTLHPELAAGYNRMPHRPSFPLHGVSLLPAACRSLLGRSCSSSLTCACSTTATPCQTRCMNTLCSNPTSTSACGRCQACMTAAYGWVQPAKPSALRPGRCVVERSCGLAVAAAWPGCGSCVAWL